MIRNYNYDAGSLHTICCVFAVRHLWTEVPVVFVFSLEETILERPKTEERETGDWVVYSSPGLSLGLAPRAHNQKRIMTTERK